jgi:adenylate kinase family enzyme
MYVSGRMSILFIGTTGLHAAGKTALAKEIAEKFNINHIRTDDMRHFLISNIKYYDSADYSHHNPLIDSANKIVAAHRNALIKELTSKKQSFILDSCGSTKEKRKNRFGKAFENGNSVKTVIIYVKTPEETVLSRLDKRDNGNGRKWVQNHKTFFKERFEEPSETEADHVLVYDGTNKEEVFEKIREILN